MATKKVLVQIEVEQTGSAVPKVTKEVDKLTAATKRLKYEQSDEAKEVAKVNVQRELQRKINKKVAIENIELANSTEEVTESLREMKTTSGLTGAIVTELGRTASDSAYGIRGMGNNISQLVTLFGILNSNVQKAGGTMKDAFSQVFQSMKGVIGILTAFQVVLGVMQAQWFQKWFDGLVNINSELKEYNELIKEATKNTKANVIVAEQYVKVLEDVNSSEKERKVASQELISLIPTLKDEDEKYGINLDRVREKIYEYALAQASRIEIDKLVEENSEKLAEQAAIRRINSIEDESKKIEAVKDFLLSIGKELKVTEEELVGQTQYGTGIYDKTVRDKTFNELTRDLSEYSTELDKDIKPITDKINELRKGLLVDTGGSNVGRSKKVFKEGLLDLSKLEERYRQESKKSEIKTEKELIDEKAKFAKKDLELTLRLFNEKEQIRLDNFIKKQNLLKKESGADVDAINKSISEAKKRKKEVVENAKEESKEVIKQIDAVSKAEKTILTRREAERARAEKKRLERSKLKSDISTGDEGSLLSEELMQAQLARIQNEVDYQKKLTETTVEGSRERFEAEQAYLDAERQKRDFELSYEQYVVDEKQRINSEYIGWVRGLSSVLSSISKDNEAIQKAALAIDKGAAIAKVVVDANASINKRMSANRAIPSLSPFAAALGVVKRNPARVADNVLAAKDIARTKVSAGVAIAGITAAGIGQASSIGGSGGSGSGGGGASVQPPDFNIVGSTGVNQLAEAIGSTEKKPVKAYVVGSDVTTQQALDRNIRSSAEL